MKVKINVNLRKSDNKQDCNVNGMFLKYNKMQLKSWYGFIATEFTNTYSNNRSVQSHTPKGAKVYHASRRRSSKRVWLKGQLAPHRVP